VELGSRNTLELAIRILQRDRKGSRISWISPAELNDHWLSLDWEAGAYSCGNDPVIIYKTGGSR
jgi:hypothetical protein